MRPLLGIATVIAMLAGCSSNWTLQLQATGERVTKPYFLDADGDGWGDANSEARLLQGVDIDAGYTARNNRDCDDNDPAVTGLVGAVCPKDLVTGDSDWVGHVGATSEYVAMIAPSATVWPDEAALACALGWGDDGTHSPAAIAVFDSAVEAAALTQALDAAGVGEYAGFIGLEYTASGEWAWIDGSTLEVASVGDGWCRAEGPQPVGQLAALVHTGGRWCVGLPEDAQVAHPTVPDGSTNYGNLYAHFICKRGVPDPYDYRVPPEAPAQ